MSLIARLRNSFRRSSDKKPLLAVTGDGKTIDLGSGKYRIVGAPVNVKIEGATTVVAQFPPGSRLS